jgi:hypothetical protein
MGRDAQHTLWLEGFTLSAGDKALFERLVRAEITRAELHAAVMEIIGKTSPDALGRHNLLSTFSLAAVMKIGRSLTATYRVSNYFSWLLRI